MVPDFTPGEKILSAGGMAYSGSVSLTNITASTAHATTGVFTSGSFGNQAADTTDLDSGETSSALGLFGGFTPGTSGSGDVHFTGSAALVTDAKLTGGSKAYKTTANIIVAITVQSNNYSYDSELTGNTSIVGSILLKQGDGTLVGTVTLSSGHNVFAFPSSAATKITKAYSATFNHTVGGLAGSLNDYYIEINGVRVTNNGITEEYQIAHKSFTYAAPILNTVVYFTGMAHSPSNKKVEIAPAGIQAVFLSELDLENAGNKYFRVSPAEDKVVDILGEAYITGSLKVKSISSTSETELGAGYIVLPTGAANGYRFGTSGEMYYDSGIKWSSGNLSTLDMVLSTGGALHTRDDITAFSTTVTSDKKFKKNVIPIQNGLSIVQQLQGVEFDWYKEYKEKGHDIGFIAQDVQKIKGLESLVKNKYNIRTEGKALTLSYEKITAVLVEAIKEQQTQIKYLQDHSHEPQNYKKKCDEMEERIIELEKKLEEL